MERCLGVLDAPALCALVELDLPDRLHRPSTAAELATAAGCDADDARTAAVVPRVARVRAPRPARSVLGEPRHPPAHARRRVERVGALPRRAVDDGVVRADPRRGAATAPTRSSRPTASTSSTYLAAHPDAAEAFHDAMAAGARLQALMIEGSLDLARRAGGARRRRQHRSADRAAARVAPRAHGRGARSRRGARRRARDVRGGRASPTGPSSSPATSSRRCRRASTCTCSPRCCTTGATTTACASCSNCAAALATGRPHRRGRLRAACPARATRSRSRPTR